jgi:glutathione synthase
MKTHIIYLNHLTSLNLKKDSSLLLAHTLKTIGIQTYLLFEDDLCWSTERKLQLKVYNFESMLRHSSFYLEHFSLKDSLRINLNKGDVLHMRIDPPFDGSYLRRLWLLQLFQETGIQVCNSPQGIMLFNEKLTAFQRPEAYPSWVGSEIEQAEEFILSLPSSYEFIVMKPLELFSGIGVEKVSRWNWKDVFTKKSKDHPGSVVIQPFLSDVTKGEVRALFFRKKELGSILKIPKEGHFISNIAQGASYRPLTLSSLATQRCLEVCDQLERFGVDWIAFDILSDVITEVNTTCPGLLVEVSEAHQRNLALEIARQIGG